MTIRHIVLIGFPEGVDPAFLDRLDAATADLAGAVPEVLHAAWGRDISGNDGNAGYAMLFDFADRAAYETYRAHPAHQAYIRDQMRAVPMTKTRLQMALTTGAMQ